MYILLILIFVVEYVCFIKLCKNGVSCIDTMGGFICTCVSGWIGVFCEGCKYKIVKISKIFYLNSRICIIIKWNIYVLC